MSTATALDHSLGDTHKHTVERSNLPLQAIALPTSIAPVPAADSLQQPTSSASMPNPRTSAADALLLIFADALDDLERVRIATENRVRSLVQVKGMEDTPEQAQMQGLCDGLRKLEHTAELQLKHAIRSHPLGSWVKRTLGIGEKQGARLLAAIGDPAERRTVSQLWAYCGYHVLHPGHPVPDTQADVAGVDPSSDTGQSTPDTHIGHAGVAPSRKRGQKANWNATAKMRAFLIAESCMKTPTSPYRKVYDAGRTKYAESTHQHKCTRCGPSGHPAVVGSLLNPGHQHARALRLVAKAVLRDLWIEARRLQEAS